MKKNLISITQVCALTNCSAPTIYRRIKDRKFPKAKKVAAVKVRGPRTIHRWDQDAVMKWLLDGNDPKWTKHRKSIGIFVDEEKIISKVEAEVRHDINWNMAAIASGLVCLIAYVYFWV
jgi:predicted DNA-binding transcriptional regulator AlpA